MPEDRAERRLTTILAADVVGYSRLMGEDETGTLAALKAHRKELIEPKTAQYHGRVVKLMGDGTLMEFRSVVDAVIFAVEFQCAMLERNTTVSEDRRITYRVGINIGDIIVEGDDIYGDGVNVAARLEGLADPGGICISHSAYNQIKSKIELNFEHLGEQKVKNIAEPVSVYRVLIDDSAAGLITPVSVPEKRPWRRAVALAGMAVVVIAGAAVWYFGVRGPAPLTEVAVEANMAFPLPDKPSIAVLPFDNLSGDPKQDYFSTGTTESIITALSQFPDLFVIARNSAFTYKDRPVKQVAEELGARYVLKGSVQRSGDRVRFTAQLIDALSGHHLWAERNEGESKDIFDLQDEITRRIVGTLAAKLTDLEQKRAFAKPTSNLEAYDYVLRGREHLSRRTRPENFEARKVFERAIELDPRYASAYVALGWTHMHSFFFGWTEFPADALEQAHDLAQKAVSLEASNARAHALLGQVYLNWKLYDLATTELARAIELNPNDADIYASHGTVMLWSSRPDEAIVSFETAQRFDPNMNPPWKLGLAYYLQGRYDDAITALKRSIGQNPDHLFSHVALAATYGQLNRLEDASREAATVLRLYPFFEVDSFGSLLANPTHRAHIAAGLDKAGLQ